MAYTVVFPGGCAAFPCEDRILCCCWEDVGEDRLVDSVQASGILVHFVLSALP